ncbi:MAG: Ig-like domain-containing protein [Planctomycetota bacterium]
MLFCGTAAGQDDASKLDQYGGLKELKSEGTGFFRIEEFEGREFLVTPEGHGYRAIGLNHFHNMSSQDHDAVIRQIKSWGFNAGCYQGPRWMWNRYPYTKGINLIPVCVWKPDSQFGYRDVFDSDVLDEIEESVRKIVQPQSYNKMLIGYFWTDIPIWTRKRRGGWIEFYKSLPPDSSGGKMWRHWKTANADSNESDFLVLIANQLYAKGHQFVRKYDKNHLIFGDRYHEVDMPEAIVRASLPYIDAISVQPTSRQFNFKFFDQVYQQYGKPIYIADHVSSFATKDHPTTMGQVTQDPDAYADYYRRYVTAAMSRPYMIGYNKCQYQDQPTPQLLKQGLIQSNSAPYAIVGRVREANLAALQYAYSGTEPTDSQQKAPTRQPDSQSKPQPAQTGKSERQTPRQATQPGEHTLKITTPTDGERFSTDDDIKISATVDFEKLGGRQVRFYYMDKKWEPIGHDESAPFEATWKSPPAGTWDIYVAVHDNDWKIVAKSHITITVE